MTRLFANLFFCCPAFLLADVLLTWSSRQLEAASASSNALIEHLPGPRMQATRQHRVTVGSHANPKRGAPRRYAGFRVAK
jgi:hypothetical protein